jgi:putative transposase
MMDWTPAAMAEQLIAESCLRQLIARDPLTLHSDRGAPTRTCGGAGVTAKSLSVLTCPTDARASLACADLGVMPRLARPRLPDDNAFSEAQFKTVKYHPTFPGRFGGIQDARTWFQQLLRWYNHEHHHTALGLTPALAAQVQV